jgi:hypothetical protein
LVRRGAGALALALIAALTAGARPATASPSYVDGISDQGLAAWDGGFAGSYFASMFRWAWIEMRPRPIVLARYVVQWNLLSGGYPHYRAELEAWLHDVRSLGLVPDLVLTSFDGVLPRSEAEYRAALYGLLARAGTIDPIAYLEPWNEPNDQGGYRRVGEAATPAGFANAAGAACSSLRPRCAIVAGDVQDSPDAGAYLEEYRRRLAFAPAAWGVHPYYSLAERSEAPLLALESHLPAGARVWFTEIAARLCTDFAGREASIGGRGQAALAAWLVEDLIPRSRPEHVFYYDLLPRERRAPECAQQREDPFLYEPGGGPQLPDVPRPAAAVIYDERAGADAGPAPEGSLLAGPWAATANPLLLTLYGAAAPAAR